MAFRLLQKEINNIVTGNILRMASPLSEGQRQVRKSRRGMQEGDRTVIRKYY